MKKSFWVVATCWMIVFALVTMDFVFSITAASAEKADVGEDQRLLPTVGCLGLIQADEVYEKQVFFTTDSDRRIGVPLNGRGVSLKEYLRVKLPENSKILCIQRGHANFMFQIFYTR